jgi:hypothetical protein
MPFERDIVNSFANGELDPQLAGRDDIDAFYSSLRRAENVRFLPQGGARRREALAHKRFKRGITTQLDLTSGVTVTAPNGGDADAAVGTDDSDAMITTGGYDEAGKASFVVLHFDFGSAERVDIVDLVAAGLEDTETPSLVAMLVLESSTDDSAWTVRGAIAVGTVKLDRRFANAPGVTLATARYWRLRLIDGDFNDGSHTVEFFINKVEMRTEATRADASTAVGNHRAFKISPESSEEFAVILTGRTADVFTEDGDFVVSLRTPFNNARVADVRKAARLNTLLLFHSEVATQFVQKLDNVTFSSAATEWNETVNWQSGRYYYVSRPQFNFGDRPRATGTNEIQELDFSSMTDGATFKVTYDSEDSETAAWSFLGGFSTNIAGVLENRIESVTGASVRVNRTSKTGNGAAIYKVEFIGASGSTNWATLVLSIVTGSGTISVSTPQQGKTATEPLFSDTRGWPSCGEFYQRRLWLGGFPFAPNVIAGSRIDAPQDFEGDDSPVASSPIIGDIDAEGDVTVRDIVAGQALMVFTATAEFAQASEPITPDNFALKLGTAFGCSSSVPPLVVGDVTIFANKTGRSLREVVYSDARKNFVAPPLSLRAPHLIGNPDDMKHRPSVREDDPSTLLTTANGRDLEGNVIPAVEWAIDRDVGIFAGSRFVTGIEGLGDALVGFVAFKSGKALAITRRTFSAGGITWDAIEKFDADSMSDAGEKIANPDVEYFNATASQTVFTYTFTSPAEEADIGVFALNGSRYDPVDRDGITINLGAKTVTFATGRAAGDSIAILRRQTSATITLDHLDGVELYCHNDGVPLGPFTPSSNVIDLDVLRFDFELEVGLPFVPLLTLQAFKGRGSVFPATFNKMRYPRCLLQLYRTAAAAVGIDGESLAPLPTLLTDVGVTDQTLEELMFTGSLRVGGIAGWRTEPRITVSQTEPAAFTLLSATYDVRF